MLPPPPPDIPITPACHFCDSTDPHTHHPPSAADALALARRDLCLKLSSQDDNLSSAEFKPQAGISASLAKAIAIRSVRQIDNLKPFAESIRNDSIRVAFDKIFSRLWEVQLENLPDKDQEAFFSFWLLEHIWPKWESNSAYRTPGLFEEVWAEYVKRAEERGQNVNEKEVFVAVVAKMSDGIVKYFSGPAEIENRESGSVVTTESLPERLESAADLATEVSSMDTIPTLLFLLLLNALIFISPETPIELRSILIESMSSCLAITLGPKCISYTLVAFVSAFLQEYKGITRLIHLGEVHADLTRPSFHILASLLDILDDFNIISEEEAFQLLLREAWESMPVQTKLVTSRCINPLLFTDIAFCAIQNAVSLLHISQRKELVGPDFPEKYTSYILDLLTSTMTSFTQCFDGQNMTSGAVLASAAKLHGFLNLSWEILPTNARQRLTVLRNEIEAFGGVKFNWEYMLSSRKDVNVLVTEGVLENSGSRCGDYGHVCHKCRNLEVKLTPKLVLGQKVLQTGGRVKKHDVVSIDEWMKELAQEIEQPDLLLRDKADNGGTNERKPVPQQQQLQLPQQQQQQQKEKGVLGKLQNIFKGKKDKQQQPVPPPPVSNNSVIDGAEAVAQFEGVGGRAMGGGSLRTPIPIEKEELSLHMRMVNLETLDVDRLMNETAVTLSRAFTTVEYGR